MPRKVQPMLSADRFPPFDDSDFDVDDWDDEGDVPKPQPFARCEHALAALRAGDVQTALETLAERPGSGDLADRMAGEAENLIRSGLIADAEARLERAAEPKFPASGNARDAYRKAIFLTRQNRLVALLQSRGLEFAP